MSLPKKIIDFILKEILEFGGLVGLFMLFIKFFGKTFWNWIISKYKYALNVQLEKQKALLERKCYISKEKFDYCTAACFNISEIMHIVFEGIKTITPESGTITKDSVSFQSLNDLKKNLHDLKTITYRNKLILPPSLYEELIQLVAVYSNQIEEYENFCTSPELCTKFLSRNDINTSVEKTSDLLRTYYESLEVLNMEE